MIRRAMLFVFPVFLGCTGKNHVASVQEQFCREFLGDNKEKKELNVENLYISGGLIHGSIGLDKNCPSKVMSLVFDEGAEPEPENKRNLEELRKQMLFKPAQKSGMYVVSGKIELHPARKEIVLKNVRDFHEVSMEESRQIDLLITKSRKESARQ